MPAEPPFAFLRDWPAARLGDVTLKIGSGATPTGGEAYYLEERSRFALVRSQNVFDRRFDADGVAFISDEQADQLRGATLAPGDVLLNITGDGITFGRACMVDASILPACVNQHVAIIRVNPRRADPGFVLSFLTHPSAKAYIGSFNAGGSRRAVTKASIEAFCLPLPPLREQQAIGGILGALDDKIELNRKMAGTLEGMARALFRSWFVDFDPVRAKEQGRPTGLPDNLSALFPDRLVDGVPEGWRRVALATLASTARGLSYNGEGLTDGGLPLVNLNSIHEGGGYKYDGLKHYAGTFLARHEVRGGDLIVANTEQGHERRLIAFAAMVPGGEAYRAIFSQHIYRVRPKPTAGVSAHWLLHLLNSPHLHGITSRYANGSTVNMLPADALQKPTVVVPNDHRVLAAFDAVAGAAQQGVELRTSEAQTLTDLRDTLLPKLISGELRIADAERAAAVA